MQKTPQNFMPLPSSLLWTEVNVLWSNATEEVQGAGHQEESTDWLHQSTHLYLKDADPSTLRSAATQTVSTFFRFAETRCNDALSHLFGWQFLVTLMLYDNNFVPKSLEEDDLGMSVFKDVMSTQGKCTWTNELRYSPSDRL